MRGLRLWWIRDGRGCWGRMLMRGGSSSLITISLVWGVLGLHVEKGVVVVVVLFGAVALVRQCRAWLYGGGWGMLRRDDSSLTFFFTFDLLCCGHVLQTEWVVVPGDEAGSVG
jgi:hypothetical protein